MDDRRKVLRREVDIEVTFVVEGEKHRTRASQLSEFGMLVGPLQDPQAVLNKRVEVDFALPDEKPFHLKGSVAYVTTTAAGVRFEGLPGETKAALEKYVNQAAA